MFSYYGSKASIIHKYPIPRHERIIEPFAGSARYALDYYGRDVWINDVDPVIYGIWNWLVNEAAEDDLTKLPEIKLGDDLRQFKWLSKPERDFLGFCLGKGRESPGNIVTAYADQRSAPKETFRPNSLFQLTIRRATYYLPRIKRWRVTNCSFSQILVNPEATWFIDPPYQGPAGRSYIYNSVDYSELSTWCLSRKGQVIVCEGAGGNWLPFRELKVGKSKGIHRPLQEKIYHRV